MARPPLYPTDLPYRPLRDRYGEDDTPIVVRTPMEFGNARQRVTRSIPTRARSYALRMTQRQKDHFFAFWRDKINQGAAVFRMRVNGTAGRWDKYYYVQIQEGKVHYVPSGSFSANGKEDWIVSFTLEVMQEAR